MDNTNNIITTNITEKELHPVTGMLMLIINIVGILFSMLLCVISPLLFYGAAGGGRADDGGARNQSVWRSVGGGTISL